VLHDHVAKGDDCRLLLAQDVLVRQDDHRVKQRLIEAEGFDKFRFTARWLDPTGKILMAASSTP